MDNKLDTKGILRLIESIPSKNAEPFKLWLAQIGKERIDEVFDPELAINRAVNYYRTKGYDDKWIKTRLTGVVDRRKKDSQYNEYNLDEFIIHPCETIKEVLEERNMSVEELAENSGTSLEYMQRIIDGKESITEDFAEKLEKIFKIKKSFWLNLQDIYDKEILKYKEK